MSSAEAGPSRSRFLAKSELAPIHVVPTVSLLSVEYPGYVDSNDPESVQRAIATLGGQTNIDAVLASTDTSSLEVNYGRTTEDHHAESRWRHGLLPTTVTGDKLVLRIRKRTKVRVEIGPDGEKRKVRLDHGEFTTEVVGPVAKIVRYRAIADYQYRPADEGLQAKVITALAHQDYNTLSRFEWPTINPDYTERIPTHGRAAMDVDEPDRESDWEDDQADDPNSKLVSTVGMHAPPRFTMQSVPIKYNFKSAWTTQMLTTNALDEDRYVLKNKNKGIPMTIYPVDGTDPVPSETANKAAMGKADQKLLAKVRLLFSDPGTVPGLDTRPVWSKHALGNMFQENEGTIASLLKPILTHVAYCFHDGAFRETLIRYGYDPRADPKAKIYQPAHLRIVGKQSTGIRSLANRTRAPKQPDILPGGDPRRTHVFNGLKLHKEFSGFQLCDITDPQLAEWINADENALDTFQVEDGWYRPTRLRLIKRLLREKFICLREHGVPLPAPDCQKIIDESLEEERVLEAGGKVAETPEEKEERERIEKEKKVKKPIGRPRKTPGEKAAAKNRGPGAKIRGAAEEEKIAARLRRDLGITNAKGQA